MKGAFAKREPTKETTLGPSLAKVVRKESAEGQDASEWKALNCR
jgi:hypothetical protein